MTVIGELPNYYGNSKTGQNKIPKTPYIDKYGKDITRLAREGRLDPVIGRSAEIKKVAQILVQKRKNNPILVGDAGVGKTCIVEGFAQHVVHPDALPQIRDFRVIELNMGSLVAGTKFRGEFEERVDTIIKEASSNPNVVLFFDEVHLMVGAGVVGEGGIDAGNILKPALARGEIKCIGATTTAEYRKYIEKDPALERRFQLVWVDEPTYEEAVAILRGVKPRFEEHYGMQIPDKVLEKAVSLSMRYMTDFRLPDKAIDIIDQACAAKLLRTLSPGSVDSSEKTRILELEDIASVVSERCRVPAESLTSEESERLLKMEEYLKQRVIGQDHAVKIVSEATRCAKAGLKDPKKPAGVFMFLGSTGTGKTELAKALAEFLFYDENNLITFDMSEYQEQHSISKLIGAPPGYLGYEQEGYLTGKIRTNPFSVLLFDEIEKAHPEVLDIFLQIFDEGRLTDSHGRKVNFSETIIILTSNLGGKCSLETNHRIGFAAPEIDIGHDENAGKDRLSSIPERDAANDDPVLREYEENIMKAVSDSIRPEILNRIQKKVVFYPLGRETVLSIIGKILGKLNNSLAAKGLQVELDEYARDFLLNKGYSRAFGAREMQRAFDIYITEPLSQLILKGELKETDMVKVTGDGEGLKFNYIQLC